MNLNSNIYNSNQKLFNIDLNIISWCNVKVIPQNLSSIVPTITKNFLNDIPPITSVISNEKKIENYDNLINQEWSKQSCNLFMTTSNNLSINGNIECSDFILNNSNIKNFSSNISINKYDISTNGTINSILSDSNSYYIIFTSNGYLNLPQDLICDIIVVGAGGNGGNDQYNNEYYNDGLLYEIPPIGNTFFRHNGTHYTPYMDINNNDNNSSYKTELFITNFKTGAGIYDVHYTSLDSLSLVSVGGNLYNAFTKTLTGAGTNWYLYDGWSGSGMYVGSKFLEFDTKGEWVYVKSVLPFIANRVLLYSNTWNRHATAIGYLYASNDGINWDLIIVLNAFSGDYSNKFFSNSKAYIYYAFMLKRAYSPGGNHSNNGIQEIFLFGYFFQNNNIYNNLSGGGGNGEILYLTNYKLTAGNYDIQVGGKVLKPLIEEDILIVNGIVKQVVNNNTSNYCMFMQSGSITFKSSVVCEIFMIGGGGGGGYNHGGGGGAGAYYRGTQTLTAGTYNITIGDGGRGGTSATVTSISGDNTSISINNSNILIVKGGGYGGGDDGATNNLAIILGGNGGCGGGGGSWNSITSHNTMRIGGYTCNIGTNGSGFAGGSGYDFHNGNILSGAGGGGIGSVGNDGNATGGGNGGSGLLIDITGENLPFGAGGGGGGWLGVGDSNGITGSAGGITIAGITNTASGTRSGDGASGTGSGGGGGTQGGGLGGKGGSGIVIIKYKNDTNISNLNYIINSNNSNALNITNKVSKISKNNIDIITAKGGGNGELNIYLNKDTPELKLNENAIISFNNESNISLNAGTYNTNFLLKTGNIDFINTSNLDKSYPILKDTSGNDINPTLWYKFDNPLNIGEETYNPQSNSLFIYNYNSNYNFYSTESCKGNYSFQGHGGGNSQENISVPTHYLSRDIGININNINWSISLWVFFERGYNYYDEPFFNWGSDRNQYKNFYAGYNTGRQIYIDNYNSRILSTSSYYEDVFVWTHIVYTFNTTTRAIRIYRNGCEVGYGIFNSQFNTNGVLQIGTWWNNEYKFKGKIDDFRVYRNLILTPIQVMELYEGRVEIFPNKTSAEIVNPIAWYKFDSNNLTIDSSSNSYSLTNVGTVISNSIEQSCAEFNGTNYFQINQPAIFTPSTFSIAMWIKLIYNNTYKAIAGCRSASPVTGGWNLYVNNTNLEIWTGNNSGGGWDTDTYYYNFVDANHTSTATAIWKHLVIIFKNIGTNQATVSCYINGLFIKSRNYVFYQNTTTNLRIGAGVNESSSGTLHQIPSGSLISDFKFYNIELNQNQISQLYNYSTHVYSNCDLLMDSSNLYQLSSNTLVKFNYSNNLILSPNNYYVKFFRGTIGFNYPTIRNYPIISNLTPILWYKFENSNNFQIDSISNNNLWNSNAIYRDFNSIILPDLWYKFDDNTNLGLNSGALSGYNLTNNGVVTTDTTFTIKGVSCAYFDSSLNDYLQLPSGNTNVSLFQNLNFSICFWHYPTDNSQGLNNIFAFGAGVSFHIFYRCQSLPPQMQFDNGSDGIYVYGIDNNEFLYKWTFWCYTFNTITRQQIVYVNGIFRQTRVASGQVATIADTYFNIGRYGTTTSGNAKSYYLDDFRFYRNRILTPDDVKNLYLNGHNDKSYPTIKENYFSIKGQGSLHFSSNLSNYALIPNNIDFNNIIINNGGLSICFWFCMNSITQNNGYLIHFGTNTTTDLSGVPARYIGIRRNLQNSQMICEIGGGFENQATAQIFTAQFDITMNEWMHFTWTIPNKGYWKIYINSSLVYNDRPFTATSFQGNSIMQEITKYEYNKNFIGRNISGNYFVGNLTDFRIYNRIIVADEVFELFNGKAIIYKSKVIEENCLNNGGNAGYSYIMNSNKNTMYSDGSSRAYISGNDGNIQMPVNLKSTIITDNTNNINPQNSLIIYNNTNKTYTTDNLNRNISFTNGKITTTSYDSSKFDIYNKLFENNPPWGVYLAEDWRGTTLYDISGNNRHATTTGTITKTTANGNGASAPITYISGGTAATVTWPSGSIPTNFTILGLTRYIGGNNQRILQSRQSGNWLLGHLLQKRGLVYFENWKTQNTNSIGNLFDWLCCIGKNDSRATDFINNILIDGTPSATATGGTGNLNLGINNNLIHSGQESDWAFGCVMIWDKLLSDTEMVLLNSLINDYKSGVVNPRIFFPAFDYNYSILRNPDGTTINPIVWYKFDGSATQMLLDSSGNNNHLINSGGATFDSTNLIKGDGSLNISSTLNQYVVMPRLNYNLINTMYGISFSFWIRLTNASENNGSILEISSYGTNNANLLIMRSVLTNNLRFYSEKTGTTTVDISTSGINFFDGTWKFITWTISTTGFWTIYSNAISILTNSGRILPVLDATTNTNFIGSRSDMQTCIDGNIDDFRIYLQVLTQEQVSHLYYSRHIDKSYPNLKVKNETVINPIVWYKFDDSSTQMLLDSSGNNNTLINNGAIFESQIFIKGNGSISFDGSYSKFIKMPYVPFHTIIDNQGITFSLWILLRNIDNTSYRRVFSFFSNGANNNNNYISLINFINTNEYYFELNNGITSTNTGRIITVNLNVFYHIIWSISNTGVWTIYLNGNLIYSQLKIKSSVYSSSSVTNLFARGCDLDLTNFNGLIDDFRIYEKVLSQAEISELYSRNTSYPILTVSFLNPKVWYKFDDSTNLGKDEMNNFNLTNTNTIIDNLKVVKNAGSLNFNSAGYLVASTSLLNNMNSYTISIWLYMNTLGTYIITSKQHNGNNTYAVLSIGCYSNNGGTFTSGIAGKIYYHSKNNATEAISNSILIINRWYYITIIASITKCLIYINGILDSSTTGDYSLPNVTNVTNSHIGYWFADGSQKGSFINGNIDDFRIYEQELTSQEVQELYKGRVEIISSTPNTNGFIENITGSNLIIGQKGIGANYYNYFSNSKPSFGSGGHGAGYMGGSGLVIVKIPNYVWSNININYKQIKNIDTNYPLIADKTNIINLNYNSNQFYIDSNYNLNYSNVFSNLTIDNINNIIDINSNTNQLLKPYLNYSSGFNYVLRKFPSTGYHLSSTLETETSEILNGRKCLYQSFQVTTNSYDKGNYNVYYSSSIIDNNVYTLKTVFDADMNDGNDGLFAYTQYDSTTGYYIAKWNNYIKSNYKGDWVILKLPYAIILKKYIVYARINVLYRAASEWKVYGSVDGNNFDELDEIKIKQDDYINHKFEKTINNNKYYNYFGFTFGRILLSPITGDSVLQLSEIELYDYYYTDTNINEINNQNEYLNGFNNNLCLIRKFPSIPHLISSGNPVSTTTILGGRSCLMQTFTITNYRGNTYDLGTYTVYASSTWSADANSARLLFNGNTTNVDPHFANSQYRSQDNYYRYDLNNYINPDYKGDWVILKLPYPIILREYIIYGRPGVLYRAPGDFILYGSIDGNTFIELDKQSITQEQYANNKFKGYLNIRTYYQFYGITVNRKAVPQGDAILNFSQIEFYDYYSYNNYIGIDNNNPQALIHLANNNNQTININFDGVVNLSKTSNQNVILNNTQNKDIIIGTSNIERLRIKNSGNVGIGTTNPTSKFEINDFISLTDFNIKYSSIQSSTNASSYGLYCVNLKLNNYNLFLDKSIVAYNIDQFNGDNFIINRTGIYSINFNFNTSATPVVWLDRNQLATASNTDVNGINLLAISTRGNNFNEHSISYTGLLNKNDVIRFKANPKFSSSWDAYTGISIDFIMAVN